MGDLPPWVCKGLHGPSRHQEPDALTCGKHLLPSKSIDTIDRQETEPSAPAVGGCKMAASMSRQEGEKRSLDSGRGALLACTKIGLGGFHDPPPGCCPAVARRHDFMMPPGNSRPPPSLPRMGQRDRPTGKPPCMHCHALLVANCCLQASLSCVLSVNQRDSILT